MHDNAITKYNFMKCVILLASLKSRISCEDVYFNGISEHKQATETEIQTKLLAQFLSKTNNGRTIKINIRDYSKGCR